MAEVKIKVLVVDDDDSTRQMYAEIFSNAGFEVLEARDGVDGLDIATKELPNVIFTGIIMPRMDGFTLMETLRKNVSTANIPIIIHSHMGREEDQQRANILGAKDFVVRGMTPPAKIVEKINNLIINKGITYSIEIDPNSNEMKRLARDFNLNENFHCMDCKKSQLVMELRLLNSQENTFQARFLCPSCGWVAK